MDLIPDHGKYNFPQDRVLGKQMDAIFHQPAFQELESSWRSLELLVDRTDFRENIE